MLHGSKIGIVALAVCIVPLALAAGHAVVGAQTPLQIQMTATKGLQPQLTGSSTITPLGNNQFRVDITVNGLNPNDDRAAHIHSPGTDTTDPAGCDTGGPVVYPLTDVKADASGRGTSTTMITLDASKGTPTTGWYVNVHQGSGTSVGQGVICGKIATSFSTLAGGASTGATSGATPTANGAQQLPATGLGGPKPVNMGLIAALALAAVALVGTGAYVAKKQ